MSDKKISCRNCGKEFTFTVGEQEWFQERNLKEPKNCETCRKELRKQREEQNQSERQENNQKAA